MEIDKPPHVPIQLVEYLEKVYPVRPATVPFTEQSIAFEAGVQAVITYLRLIIQQQEESLID